MVKNCDLGLENAFGHSFSPYGPPSRQITYISCVLKKFEKGSKRKVFQMNKSCEDDILSTLKAAGIS